MGTAPNFSHHSHVQDAAIPVKENSAIPAHVKIECDFCQGSGMLLYPVDGRMYPCYCVRD